MTDSTSNERRWAHRYNTHIEAWERKPVGIKAAWERFDRVLDDDVKYDDDIDFIKQWSKQVKEGGSCSDVSRYYNETVRGVQARRRAINRKLVKENNLDDDHEVLPSLPGLTEAQKNRRDSHYKPVEVPLTLMEELRKLSSSMKSVLNLPQQKPTK